jgi:hypothetical protein
VSDPWPWPADTPTERARRIARSYRNALHDKDSARCEQLDIQAAELGQGWVVPRILTVEPDDLLTRWEAAEYCDVKVKTISEWRRRGLVVTPTPDGDRYRVADLIAYQAQIRQRRTARGS